MKQLSNGWLIGPETIREQEEGNIYGYIVTKEEARNVLDGKKSTITLLCFCGGPGRPHYDPYDVVHNSDGTLSVGCTDFTLEDIALVKEWLAEKPVVATEGRE